MTTVLAHTPLTDWHASHGGRMVDFAGWLMPVQYTSIVAEHEATRRGVGLFDISHMGRLRFEGAGAAAFLDSIVTRSVLDMAVGRIRYALVTNDAGGILDDVLVYRLEDVAGDGYHLLVVNASNRQKILDWLRPRVELADDVTCTDVTTTSAMIAVQGPRALQLVQPLLGLELNTLKYYSGADTRFAGHAGIVSRTGYTGEDGCELIVDAAAMRGVWEWLVDEGATPAGLGCRDTLRLEAAMPLYGHELTEQITPYHAGLGFAVDLEGRRFPGSAALAGIKARTDLLVRIGLELNGKRVPREGYPILHEGRAVGSVTSGTFSPTFGRPLAMGYVETAASTVGATLMVDVRGREEPATVVRLPFYRRASS